jgi:hypothetical protein
VSETLNNLHPAAQVAAIVCSTAVTLLIVWCLYKLFRND